MTKLRTALTFASLILSPFAISSTSFADTNATQQPGRAIQQGEASWYGPGFQGRRTASGEIFNTNDLTAAHKTLPFGSRVRVVNKRTGKSVVVRINDRGPYARGRVIDLSRASAQALGITGVGAVSLNLL